MRNKNWYYYESEEEILLPYNIEDFLLLNPHFVQISGYDIINMCYAENYILNGTNGFMIVADIKFGVTRRYISKVKFLLKEFLNQKYGNSIGLSPKSSWLSKTVHNSEILTTINVENIKYIERKGVTSIIHYNDGKVRNFYESLKYFEQILSSFSYMVRIRRNCIVNLKHTAQYQVNSAKKIAEIKIESETFSISRRRLPTFKRRRKVI